MAIYILQPGEFVVLRVSSPDFIGVLGLTEKIESSRVVVKCFGGGTNIKVKPEDLIGKDADDDIEEEGIDEDDDAAEGNDEDEEDFITLMKKLSPPSASSAASPSPPPPPQLLPSPSPSIITTTTTDIKRINDIMKRISDLERNGLEKEEKEDDTTLTVRILDYTRDLYIEALTIDPENTVLKYSLATTMVQLNDDLGACAVFRSLAESTTTSLQEKIAALLACASALGRLGDSSGELDALSRAAAWSPKDGKIKATIAQVYLDRRDFANAILFGKQSLEIEKCNARLMYHLAKSYFEGGFFLESKRLLNKTILQVQGEMGEDSEDEMRQTWILIANLVIDLLPIMAASSTLEEEKDLLW